MTTAELMMLPADLGRCAPARVPVLAGLEPMTRGEFAVALYLSGADLAGRAFDRDRAERLARHGIAGAGPERVRELAGRVWALTERFGAMIRSSVAAGHDTGWLWQEYGKHLARLAPDTARFRTCEHWAGRLWAARTAADTMGDVVSGVACDIVSGAAPVRARAAGVAR
jgi:hypothetical protein